MVCEMYRGAGGQGTCLMQQHRTDTILAQIEDHGAAAILEYENAIHGSRRQSRNPGDAITHGKDVAALSDAQFWPVVPKPVGLLRQWSGGSGVIALHGQTLQSSSAHLARWRAAARHR
jgi:hypothetical protein